MTHSLKAGLFLSILLYCLPGHLYAQTTLTIMEDEKWYGGAVNEAHQMPFRDGYTLDLNGDTRGNQACPLLISTRGRVIWSESPFMFTFKDHSLVISHTNGSIIIDSAGKNLQEAFKQAANRWFPAQHRLPDTLLFSSPQYNTWIELVYNQNQQDILRYARAIVDNGFPPGVLMIDDNWADYYGRFDFRKDRFANATAMIDSLHQMGFKVMIWISPFVSPDTEVFRELLEKKWVLLTNDGDTSLTWTEAGKPAICSWWNGYSAALDLSNPSARQWLQGRLQHMVDTYHIDGFKLDAGDADLYPANAVTFQHITPNDYSRLWGEIGLHFPLNEYRAMWKMGGQPLVQRLRDKQHTWQDLQKLIPHITTAGLLGYQFTCPDMIGGGEFGSFRDTKTLDEELIVRSAQCSALMPMMQFSVAPWRVLSPAHLSMVKQMIALRKRYTPYIMTLAREAAMTGEPIVRSMEYAFPNQGFADAKGQFMLGNKYLVAPVLTKDGAKEIALPKGKWKSPQGEILTGPRRIKMQVPLDGLPVYEHL